MTTLPPTIQALDTEYNGHHFRSRTEARWALFFDTLGLEWQYEVDGYQLADGTKYQPDFLLPADDVWFEVKGPAPTPAECQKADGLALGSGKSVFVAWGGVKTAWHDNAGIDVWYPEGIKVSHQYWTEYADGTFHIAFMGWRPRGSGDLPICRAITPRLLAAYRAANTERFGH